MIRLATVIDTFAADFRTQYGSQLSSAHLQALAAMRRCRTQASAKMLVQQSGQIVASHDLSLVVGRRCCGSWLVHGETTRRLGK